MHQSHQTIELWWSRYSVAMKIQIILIKTILCMVNWYFVKFIFLFFSVRLFVGSAWSFVFFPSPPQLPMTSDFEGFSIPDFIHYIYFPILRKSQYFPFLIFSAKQGHYWYHLFNAVLDWGLNPGPPSLDASSLSLGYRGGGSLKVKMVHFL